MLLSLLLLDLHHFFEKWFFYRYFSVLSFELRIDFVSLVLDGFLEQTSWIRRHCPFLRVENNSSIHTNWKWTVIWWTCWIHEEIFLLLLLVYHDTSSRISAHRRYNTWITLWILEPVKAQAINRYNCTTFRLKICHLLNSYRMELVKGGAHNSNQIGRPMHPLER